MNALARSGHKPGAVRLARPFTRSFGSTARYAGLSSALSVLLSCGERPTVVPDAGTSKKTTSRRELRELAQPYVCWMRGDVSEPFSPVLGDLGCRSAAGDRLSPLAGIVERAVADAIPILRFSMDSSASELALNCPPPNGVGMTEPATRCLIDGFWKDANLGGVVELGLSRSVEDAGWVCEDCTSVAPFREQAATLEDIEPFVSAYVWPVQSDGGKTVEILICSGANGTSATDGNPVYLRLGFLAAQGFVESDVVRPELARLAELGREGALDLEEMKLQVARVLASAPARLVVCETAERFWWYTRLRLTDCRGEDGA